MLRVHSADLHDHVAQEIGECLETGDKLDLFVNKAILFIFLIVNKISFSILG